jgi:hypothetical protein
MPRLPVGNALIYRGELDDWTGTAEVHAILRRANNELGDRFVFHRGAKAYREAWVAARWASATSASAIKCQDCPDVLLRYETGIEPWEITEAIEPYRPRNRDYKEAADQQEVCVDDWERRRDEIIPTLKRRCADKSLKPYASNSGLLIYLNMGIYGLGRAAVEADLHAATEQAGRAFNRVGMIWEGRAYDLWSAGHQVNAAPTDYEECLACQ